MVSLIEKLSALRVVPVVVIDRAEDALPLSQALKAGGLPVAEITFRTSAAAGAISAMAKDKDILLGAGTVLHPDQVDEAKAAGASFIVTPGFSRKVVQRCKERDMPVFPGIATATEVQMAIEEGIEVVKFFPAETLGGVKTLNSLAAPFSMMRFIPTGGITIANLGDYLTLKSVVAAGGSWMVHPSLIAARKFDEIQRLAAEAVMKAKII